MNPYLYFNGQCEAAFKFYATCLGGKITFLMPHEDTPAAEHVPAGWRKKILHATLSVGNDLLQGADVAPDQYHQPQGFAVKLDFHDSAEAEQVFQGLAENGTVQMPLQETFWAARFGMLIDRFGIPWIINCRRKENRGRSEG